MATATGRDHPSLDIAAPNRPFRGTSTGAGMTTETTLRTQTPSWATPLGAAIVVLLLLIPRVAFAVRFGLIGDEAYYAIWSFHPAFN